MASLDIFVLDKSTPASMKRQRSSQRVSDGWFAPSIALWKTCQGMTDFIVTAQRFADYSIAMAMQVPSWKRIRRGNSFSKLTQVTNRVGHLCRLGLGEIRIKGSPA